MDKRWTADRPLLARLVRCGRFASLANPKVLVYAVVDHALSPRFPLGDSLEVFVGREDAERFIDEIRGDDPELAGPVRIEERELQTGIVN